MLRKYGGMYLDNDIYVINSLDKYRRFEFVLGWPDGEWIGNYDFFKNIIEMDFSYQEICC